MPGSNFIQRKCGPMNRVGHTVINAINYFHRLSYSPRSFVQLPVKRNRQWRRPTRLFFEPLGEQLLYISLRFPMARFHRFPAFVQSREQRQLLSRILQGRIIRQRIDGCMGEFLGAHTGNKSHAAPLVKPALPPRIAPEWPLSNLRLPI